MSALDDVGTADVAPYASIVLERLTRLTCSIVGADESWISVRDDGDPRKAIAIAGHGIDDDVIGRRLGVEEEIVGRVLRSGEAVVTRSPGAAASGVAQRSTAVAPIQWAGTTRGALSAMTSDGARGFAARDVAILRELAAMAAAALEHAEARNRLDSTVEAGVEALAAAMHMRDGYTARHSDEVVELARGVGHEFRLDQAALIELEFAARLHDLGKIAIPDAILLKRGPLDAEDWGIMRGHPIWGADTLARIPGLQAVATIVRFHHERWDGSGYPEGLRGERIPLPSRIISACDAYRAMTSNRPYRAALGRETALAELRRRAGAHFDATVVGALERVLTTSARRAA